MGTLPVQVRERRARGVTGGRRRRCSFLPLLLLLVALALACGRRDPDATDDGVVDILDVSLVSSCLGRDPAEDCRCARADLDRDGDVDAADLDAVKARFGESGFPVRPEGAAPRVALTAPAPAAVVATSPVLVEGAVESDAGIHRVEVAGQRALITSRDPIRFRASLDLSPGLNAFTATAVDEACREGRATSSVLLLALDPDVNDDGRVDILDASRVASCVGRAPQELCPCRVADLDGDGLVSQADLEAIEAVFGSQGYPARPPDETPPLVEISEPPEGPVAQSPVRVAGRIDDPEAVVTVNGLPAPVIPGEPPTFAVEVPLVEGENEIEVLATDLACNQGGARRRVTLVLGPAEGVLAGEVYDDASGRPLAGAQVELVALDGEAPDPPRGAAGDGRGRYRLPAPPARARLTVRVPGYTAADRSLAVAAGRRMEPLDARLTPLAAPVALLSLVGGRLARGGAELEVPVGALAADGEVGLTPLSAGGLVRPPPPGWSVLGAAEIAPEELVLSLPATLRFPQVTVDPGAAALGARWDAAREAWLSLGEAARSAGGGLALPVTRGGQLALLLADRGPLAPPIPAAGEPLAGVELPPLPEGLLLRVDPSPRILIADPAARAQVEIHTADLSLPAGTPLEVALEQSLQFVDGGALWSEPLAADQRLDRAHGPDAVERLRALLAVGPYRSFDPVELGSGAIEVRVHPGRPEEEPRGASVGPAGGRVASSDGALRLDVPAGAADEPLPVRLEPLEPARFPPLLEGSAFELRRALVLDLHGAPLAAPAALSLPADPGVAPGDTLALVGVADVLERSHPVLVALARPQGGRLVSLLDPTGDGSVPLPGILAEGRYALFRTAEALGFAVGTVVGEGGVPRAGALVAAAGWPLAAVSGADGRFALLLPPGPQRLEAADPDTGDVAAVELTLPGVGEVAVAVLVLEETPPRVVATEPVDGARGVRLASALRVSFSEPLAPGSVGASALELSLEGVALPGRLALSPDRRALSFLPAAPLASDRSYLARVSGAVTDDAGHPLGADFVFRFTSEDRTPPARPDPGQIEAGIPGLGPGATTTVRAGPGTAEPGGLAVIANLASGALTTLLPEADGSFQGQVAAQRAERLELRLFDAAGNETRVPLGPFRDPDGRVVVGAEGGRVEGAGGVAVEIPPGALPAGTAVKVDPLAEAELPIPAPPGFPYAGGLRLDLGGARPLLPLDLAIPAPPGAAAGDQVVVAQLLELARRTAWMPVDRAHFETEEIRGDGLGDDDGVCEAGEACQRSHPGEYFTASPPFPGVGGQGTYGFFLSDGGCLSYAELHVDFAFQLLLDPFGLGTGFLFPTDVSRVVIPGPCDGEFDFAVVDPDTDEVIQRLRRRMPPGRDDVVLDPTPVTDDQTPPLLLETRVLVGALATEVEVRFSERMNPASVRENLRVEDSAGAAAPGDVTLFAGNTLAVFRSALPLRIGETYRLRLAGGQDPAGNPLAPVDSAFTPFPVQPPLSRLKEVAGVGTALEKCAGASTCNFSSRDVALLGNTLFVANGLASASEDYKLAAGGPERLLALDVTLASEPLRLGSHSTATNPRALEVFERATFRAGGTLFDERDLLVVVGGGRVPGGELFPKLELYDVSPCTASVPGIANCLENSFLGGRVLAETGVPQQVAVRHARGAGPNGEDALAAYVVVSALGLAAVDVGRALDEPSRGVDGLVTGDFLDVAVLRDVVLGGDKDLVLAVKLDSQTNTFFLEVFDPRLVLRRRIALPGPAARVLGIGNFLVDVDDDGRVGTAEEGDNDELRARDELFDLALVSSGPLASCPTAEVPCGELYVVDLSAFSDLAHAADLGVLSRIPLPGAPFSLAFDAELQLAYVELRGKGLAVVDLGHLEALIRPGTQLAALEAAALGLFDANGDGRDERLLGILPKSDVFAGRIRLDAARGLAFVNGSLAGLDVLKVADRCTDLRTDFRPAEAAPVAAADRTLSLDDRRRLEKEKRLLKALLDEAAAELIAAGIVDLALLEQGSGACFWRGDFPEGCRAFQPGTSDHDIEVLVPQAQVAQAQELLDAFLVAQEDDPSLAGIGDLSLFAFSRESFEAAELLNGTPRNKAGDATGDLALGRQLLLLLWILEGEYVPGYEGVGLDQLLELMKARAFDPDPVLPGEPSAIPRLEGHEWSLLQEFNFHKSGAVLRAARACRVEDQRIDVAPAAFSDVDELDPARNFQEREFLFQDCQSQLHSVAKAAIRSTMARLAASDLANPTLLEIDRDSYRATACRTGVVDVRAPPADPELYAPKRCDSFEEYVASLAVQSVRDGLGVFAASDLPDLFRFYCVKVGDRCANRDGELIGGPYFATDEEAAGFVARALGFIEETQELTRPVYAATVLLDQKPIGPIPFLAEIAGVCAGVGVPDITAESPRSALRLCNGGIVARKLDGDPDLEIPPPQRVELALDPQRRRALERARGVRHGVTRLLRVRALNLGGRDVRQTAVRLYDGDGVDPSNYRELREHAVEDLLSGATRVLELAPDGSPLFPVYFDLSQLVPNVPGGLAFAIDPERRVPQADREDDSEGFFYYRLDPGSPAGPPGLATEPVSPVDTTPDPLCTAPPAFGLRLAARLAGEPLERGRGELTVQLGQGIVLDYRVANQREEVLTQVRVRRSGLDTPVFELPSLPPASAAPEGVIVPEPFVPQGLGTFFVVATGSARDAQGNDVGARPSRVRISVVPPPCEALLTTPKPSPNPSDERGLPASTVMEGGRAFRYYRALHGVTGAPLANATVEGSLRQLPGGAPLPLSVATDAEGFLVHEESDPEASRRGIAFAAADLGPPGSEFEVRLERVVGFERTCPQQFTLQVRDREVSRSLTAGASLQLDGAIAALALRGKSGTGFDLTLEGTPTRDDRFRFGRSVNAEAGLGVKAAAADVSVKFVGELTLAQAKGEAFVSGIGSLRDEHVFPAPLETADFIGIAQLATGALALAASTGSPIPGSSLLSLVLDEIGQHVSGLDDLRTSLGGSLGVQVKAGGAVKGPTLGLKNTSIPLLDKIGLEIGVEAGVEGAIVGAIDFLPPAPEPRVAASLDHRAKFDVKGAISLGLSEVGNAIPDVLKKQLLAEAVGILTNLLDTQASASGGANVKYRIELDTETLAARRIVLEVGTQLAYGFKLLGEELVNEGEGESRVRRYVISRRENIGEALKSIVALEAFAAVSAGAPGVAAIALGPRIGEEIVRLLSLADSYSVGFSKGTGATIPFGLNAFLEGTGIGGQFGLQFNSATRYATEGGAFVDTRHWRLESYPENDPLIPPGFGQQFVELVTRIQAFVKNVLGPAYRIVFAVIEKQIADLISEIDFSFSPSGVTLRIAGFREPDPEVPFTVELLAFQFRGVPGPVAGLVMDPADVRGPADKPHYGVGGFFHFSPREERPLTLAAPAELEIRWVDAEVASLDEGGLAVYRWNDARLDWDYVGGQVLANENRIVAEVDRLGLYTAAPPMPAGALGFTAAVVAGGTEGAPSTTLEYTSGPIRLNTGALVPDGTSFTVRSLLPGTTALVPFGALLSSDADPQSEGVQVHSQGGVIRFAAEYPGEAGVARVLVTADEGTAFGLQEVIFP